MSWQAQGNVNAPFSRAIAITPNDSGNITDSNGKEVQVRRLYVGTAGNITILASEDTIPTNYANVPNAFYITGFIKKVMETGTDATDIVGEI